MNDTQMSMKSEILDLIKKYAMKNDKLELLKDVIKEEFSL